MTNKPKTTKPSRKTKTMDVKNCVLVAYYPQNYSQIGRKHPIGKG